MQQTNINRPRRERRYRGHDERNDNRSVFSECMEINKLAATMGIPAGVSTEMGTPATGVLAEMGTPAKGVLIKMGTQAIGVLTEMGTPAIGVLTKMGTQAKGVMTRFGN